MKQANDAQGPEGALSFDVELDAPPTQVWRALTIPEFVAQWLMARIAAPEAETIEAEDAEHAPSPPVSLRLLTAEPGRSLRYLWREEGSAFPETIVTFELKPNETGGTRFSVVHEMTTTAHAFARERPANSNTPRLRLVA
jgi:uncharacterized protein YndB with AHSA1/START domain